MTWEEIDKEFDLIDEWTAYFINAISKVRFGDNSGDNSPIKLANQYHNGDLVKSLFNNHSILSFEQYKEQEFGSLNYLIYFIEDGELKAWSGFVNGIDRTKNSYYKDKWTQYFEYYDYKGVLIKTTKELYNTENLKKASTLYKLPYS